MQTFLPYPDFKQSARVLDYRRLGKQRLEAIQILTTLKENKKAWSNHPAVLMWKGYETALVYYGMVICSEWISRGYKDTLFERFFSQMTEEVIFPPWLGDEEFHSSHRSNLLRKDFDFYSKYGWVEDAMKEYVWPSKQEQNLYIKQ